MNLESEVPVDYENDDEEDHRRIPRQRSVQPAPPVSAGASELFPPEPEPKRVKRANDGASGPAQPPSGSTLMITKIPDQSNFASKLAQHFETFGTLVLCVIDRPKQRAFVQFAEAHSAVRALKHPTAVFNNRFIEVHRVADRQLLPLAENTSSAAGAHSGAAADGAKPVRKAAERKELAEKKRRLIELKDELAKKRTELDSTTGDKAALKAAILDVMTEFKACKAAIDALTAEIEKPAEAAAAGE